MGYKNLAINSLFAYFLIVSCEGFIRYYLNIFSLSSLVYVKDLFLAVPIFILIVQQGLKVEKREAIFYLILVISTLASFLFIGNIFQLFFSIRIILPILFIFLFWQYLKIISFQEVKTRLQVIYLIAILGILLDYFLVLPWKGLVITTAGFEIQAGREWTTYGIERLSGFSRSSFNAAQTLLLSSMPLIIFKKKFKIIVSIITFVAILLTTTKGVILAYIGFIIFLMIYKKVRLRNTMYLSIFIGSLSLPLLGTIYGLNNTLDNLFLRIIFSSFITRLESTWPEAINLIFENGNLILGRGLGGIGTAQSFFEPSLYNPADNMFIYIYGTFGILGVLFLVYKIFLLRDSPSIYIKSLIIVVLLYGLTTGIVEGYLAIILGIIFSYGKQDDYILGNQNRNVWRTIRFIRENKTFRALEN